MCEYKMCEYKMCEYKMCEYKMCEYKMCEYKMCEYKMYEYAMRDFKKKHLLLFTRLKGSSVFPTLTWVETAASLHDSEFLGFDNEKRWYMQISLWFGEPSVWQSTIRKQKCLHLLWRNHGSISRSMTPSPDQAGILNWKMRSKPTSQNVHTIRRPLILRLRLIWELMTQIDLATSWWVRSSSSNSWKYSR